MSGSNPVAAFLLLAAAVTSWGLYGIVRPTPPERMRAYSGPIGFLGRWAYWVSGPLLRGARAAGLSANAITGIGAALALGAGVLAGTGEWGWAGILLVFGSWCDLIDGEIARSTRTQGKAGAFLDSNLDRLSEIALFAGLAVSLPARAGEALAVGALVGSLMVSYARARGEGLGVACPNFGMERPHRVVLLMFALLLAPFLPAPAAALELEAACALVALGAGATALGRMVVIHQQLRRSEGPRGAEAEARSVDARPVPGAPSPREAGLGRGPRAWDLLAPMIGSRRPRG
jgi:CDP-diacylglycerol--glycerol-3-phosphate 3-phosphatidyltransferase